jgi:ADP-heptose:LPS heptosyltransferase
VLTVGGLAAFLATCTLVVANDTGPLHLAAAVGTPTVGLFRLANMINGAPVDRSRHRPLISWTVHCPVCGTDSTGDQHPERGGAPPCDHRVSFIADIPIAEVRAAVRELLAFEPASPGQGLRAG